MTNPEPEQVITPERIAELLKRTEHTNREREERLEQLATCKQGHDTRHYYGWLSDIEELNKVARYALELAREVEGLKSECHDADMLIRSLSKAEEEARAVAGHTEEAGEVCTADCLACRLPVAAVIRDLKEARTLSFERGQEVERLRAENGRLRDRVLELETDIDTSRGYL